MLVSQAINKPEVVRQKSHSTDNQNH